MSDQTEHQTHSQTEELDAGSESASIVEGPIIEWNQDQWWLEGKTRIKKEKKFYQTPKGIALIGFGVILLILILIVLVSMDQAGEGPQLESEIDEELIELEESSLQEQIKRLRRQLDQADPAIRETPLPNVEMSIEIKMD